MLLPHASADRTLHGSIAAADAIETVTRETASTSNRGIEPGIVLMV
jgi:hypothetical protein